MKRLPGLLPLLALSLILAACGQDPPDQGLAARVNGHPITLRSLEFSHDIKHFDIPHGPESPWARLRAEYGEALASLIVSELVDQELERRGLEVSEAECTKAEMASRADYPGTTFETMLADEGIDLDMWRERLKAKLAVDKFTSRVLRPTVRVSFPEVQAYFKDHAGEFTQPAKLKLLRVESKTREALVKALEAARTAKDPVDLLSVFDDVTIQVTASSEERLPASWRQAVKGLAPGQASPVQASTSGFQAFLPLERTEPKVEGPVQAYPLVEKRLAETKLENAFAAWLAETLTKADIRVNPGLVPEKGSF